MFPRLFTIGDVLTVHTYGLLVALGLLVGLYTAGGPAGRGAGAGGGGLEPGNLHGAGGAGGRQASGGRDRVELLLRASAGDFFLDDAASRRGVLRRAGLRRGAGPRLQLALPAGLPPAGRRLRSWPGPRPCGGPPGVFQRRLLLGETRKCRL